MLENEADWQEADPSVLHTAEALIEEFHPMLEQARICFVFRKEGQKVKYQSVLGGVSKVPAKEQVVLEYDYMVWISKEDWEKITHAERRALIDHQLSHMWRGDSGWTIVGHDVEEFQQVIERHGMWNSALKRVDTSLAQHYIQQGLIGEKLADKLFERRGKIGTITSVQIEHMAETQP
jgi:hypothetical protein